LGKQRIFIVEGLRLKDWRSRGRT